MLSSTFPGRVNPQSLQPRNDVCFIFPALQSPSLADSEPYRQTEGGTGRHRPPSHVKGVVQRQEFSQECPCGFSQVQVAGREVRQTCKAKFFCNLASQLGCQALKESAAGVPGLACPATTHLHSPTAKTLVWFCFHGPSLAHLLTSPADGLSCFPSPSNPRTER